MALERDIATLVGDKAYDAVARIGLFEHAYDQNHGWKLALHEPSLEQLDAAHGVRVVPIGHYNSGKTWLIRKLIAESGTSLDLAVGTDVHTEGFSIKMANLAGQAQRCVFLDTAGLNSPVTSIGALGALLKDPKKSQMDAMMGMLEELKRQESFMRHVAFDFAQAFLFVVGHISHRDQMDLMNLIEQAAASKTAKEVIVVHNLKRMSLDQFKNVKDNQTGETYLESMQKVFKTECQSVRVANEGSEVEELFGAFGTALGAKTEKPTVAIRHLFLTDDNEEAGRNRNRFVIQRIRTVINLMAPKGGSVLTDLCALMSKWAAPVVRLPPGAAPVELRAHRRLGRIFAGHADPREDQTLKAVRAKALVQEHVARLTEEAKALKEAIDRQREEGKAVQKEQLDQMAVAEERLNEAMALASAEAELRVLDAEDLLPLNAEPPAKEAKDGEAAAAAAAAAAEPQPPEDGEKKKFVVSCKQIALGAVARRAGSSEKYVRHNVTRSRGWAGDMPHWLTSVHMTLPGLAKGELAKIREQLQWGEGATEVQATKTAQATLQLAFRAKVLAVPERQPATLNASGKLGKATIEAGESVTVIDAGTRPFPVARPGAAGAELDSTTLEVVVPTDITFAIDDVQPVVTYARGILSVTVATALTEDDKRAGGEWAMSDEADHVELTAPEAGANGSDDDVNV